MTDKIRLPRILVTNDDGIDAPGLDLLIELAADIADEVWVVAPEHEQSGVGMEISLHQPLRVYQRSPRRFAISGTPSDCVALALNHIMKDNLPQVLLSGINAGANCGDDINLSGTIGAALTGLMHGIPSIAISQAFSNRNDIRWDTSRAHIPAVLQLLLQHGWRKETCVSVNLPDADPELVRDVAWTRSSQKTIGSFNVDSRKDLRGNDYYWLYMMRKDAEPDGAFDTATLRRNQISISCLSLDRSISPGRQAITLYPESELHVGT